MNKQIFSQTGFAVVAFLLCFFANAQTLIPDSNGIIYVKTAASGNGDGSSWNDATSNLQGAINGTDVTKVFVAIGNYDVPSPNSFVMKNGVEIYGGFDPLNNITDLTHNRILPNHGVSEGSVLNGKNERPVIWNYQNGVTATAVLDGFTITGGYRNTNGGGIMNFYASPTLTNLVIKGNNADNGAAGIYNDNASPKISNVIIKENSAGNIGGGITNVNASSPELTNVLITGNTATNYAGGLFNISTGIATLTNVTIVGNSPDAVTINTGTVNLNNSLVFGTVSGTYTAQYSLVEGNTNFTNGNIDPTGIATTAVFTDAVNGDYTLLSTSPAVNTGNNSLNATATDLAGNSRVADSVIDMGAYEFTPIPLTPDANNILYVDINVTGGNQSGNSWANAIPQLSDALKYARLQYNTNNAVYDAQPLKIFVAKGTYKPLYSARNGYFTQTGSADPAYSDQDNAFVMVKNVQIYGGFDPDNGIDDLTDTRIFGANGSVLSGEIGNTWDINYPYINANHVVIASGDVGNALLNGFTITRAFSKSTNAMLTVFTYPVQDAFGAMYCVRSSPTVENCIFTDNHTSGGNMFNYQQSSPNIINCTFINNGTMGSGGAIYNGTGSSPTITNCSFTGNSAYGKGGAIYNYDNSSPIITNCSFKNNQSGTNSVGNGGGAIYNSASSPIIANSLFANNKAMGNNSANPNGNGGAIYNETTSSPVLTNVSIANNTGANAFYSTGTGSTTFYNSIVFGTVSATYTAQYSLIEGNTDFTNGNIDPTGITSADVFYNPANGDYTLKDTSLAVNAGNNSLNTTETDLAGNARIYNNAIIDLGAYESSFTPSACADFTTWNGTVWSNSEPDSNKKAIIDGSLVLSADLTTCELEVTTNGHLEIPSGFAFTVNGQIINNASANDFVVESNGILIQIDDVENTGAVTVKRESSPMKRLDYTLWSSPVSGMLLKNFSDVSPTGGSGTLWNRVYTLGATAWNKVWETQADFQNDTTQTFAAAQGYLYRSRNDYDAVNTVIFEGIFTGVPQNGNINIATPLDFNAIGNPYPSPVDAEAFLDQNPGILYFWTNVNASNGTEYLNNNWAYYVAGVGGTGVADVANGGIQFTPADDMLLQPGQGFVLGTEAASVTFDNTMRTTDNGSFFRQMSSEKHRYWLSLANEEVVFNQILVGYIENATQGIDTGIDAKMFAYEGNAIYSLIGNNEEKFVIQGRELPFTDSDIVPIGFRAVNAGSFTISLNNFDGLFEEGTTQIYLKDNFSQTQHNLNEGAYTFVSEEGIFDTRFEVVYQTTMSIQNPDFQHNWIVFKQDKGFQIQTQGFELKQVSVYDMLGRRIYSSQAEGTAHQIPALTADGVYILKITTTEDKVLNKKAR